jgi:translation initiation factor RLI1
MYIFFFSRLKLSISSYNYAPTSHFCISDDQAGNLRPDAVEFKMPKYNVSHKPQCIGFMMSRSTVKDMLLKKIPDAYVDPHFRSLVFQPLLIQQLMDLDNVDLSDA